MLTFAKLSKKPSQVRAFTGLAPTEFQEFAGIYRPLWEEYRLALHKAERKRAVGGGRRLSLPGFNDRLLCFLVYAKLYCTYDLLGYLFDCDAATACRTVAVSASWTTSNLSYETATGANVPVQDWGSVILQEVLRCSFRKAGPI